MGSDKDVLLLCFMYMVLGFTLPVSKKILNFSRNTDFVKRKTIVESHALILHKLPEETVPSFLRHIRRFFDGNYSLIQHW
jgi:hypothetical protein